MICNISFISITLSIKHSNNSNHDLWHAASESGHGMQATWLKRCTLVEARSSVTDIKFAPKCMGLVLATCSADGLVRQACRAIFCLCSIVLTYHILKTILSLLLDI